MTRTAETGAGVADVDLQGRTILVTGSTSGIGRETALALGRLGARVFVHGRDREQGEQVVERLHEFGADDSALFLADFARLSAVRDLASDVADACDSLDVLVNNAGGYFSSPRLTDDGFEYTIGVNHLAPFLLTNLLLPSLRATPQGRVVTVSSEAHRGSTVGFERFQTVDRYNGWRAYGRSKLANVLFSNELARREDAVTANSLHPGVVPGSGFMRTLPAPVRVGVSALAAIPNPVTDSVISGAETSVSLAASPDVAGVTGQYFDDCRRRTPSRVARDETTQRRLWDVSADLVGLND